MDGLGIDVHEIGLHLPRHLVGQGVDEPGLTDGERPHRRPRLGREDLPCRGRVLLEQRVDLGALEVAQRNLSTWMRERLSQFRLQLGRSMALPAWLAC
jgi:hypothetical protein